MFYSPSGQVFSSKAAAIKSLDNRTARPKKSPGELQAVDRGRAKDSSVPSVSKSLEDGVISLSDDEVEEPPRKRTKRETAPSVLSARQKEVLECCYREWPQPTPKVVTQITKDSGLSAQVIKDWFTARNRNIFQQILCNN